MAQSVSSGNALDQDRCVPWQVSQQHAKPRADQEETYRGVSAPKRKRVEETPTEIGEMPKVRAVPQIVDAGHTMRFGSTAKVLLKCKLKYYRISECGQPVQRCMAIHVCTELALLEIFLPQSKICL